MKKIDLAVIGYGQRGSSMTRHILLGLPDVSIVAVCDEYADRAEQAADDVEKGSGKRPFSTVDYREILAKKPDAVYVATSWETHVEIATEALEAGVAVALEVGGAYSLESLWRMVQTQERTRVPLMIMENCCFGREELFGLSLARRGVLGDVVHGHGCYGHFLGQEIASGEQIRHYRLRNYLTRNCENYPTHELGPLAKVLNVNRGNRMVSLVSVSSRAAGMEAYVARNAGTYPDLVGKKFRQGDVVNTVITCADGSTISLRLDTTLPRHYSREFTLHGTKGIYEGALHHLYLEGQKESINTPKYYAGAIGNAAAMEAEYLPAVWREMTPEQIKAGHGGMDYIEFCAFTDALRRGDPMPLDVYDAASWMAVTALSEASVAAGGLPQSFPDFTSGTWTRRPPKDVIDL